MNRVQSKEGSRVERKAWLVGVSLVKVGGGVWFDEPCSDIREEVNYRGFHSWVSLALTKTIVFSMSPDGLATAQQQPSLCRVLIQSETALLRRVKLKTKPRHINIIPLDDSQRGCWVLILGEWGTGTASVVEIKQTITTAAHTLYLDVQYIADSAGQHRLQQVQPLVLLLYCTALFPEDTIHVMNARSRSPAVCRSHHSPRGRVPAARDLATVVAVSQQLAGVSWGIQKSTRESTLR